MLKTVINNCGIEVLSDGRQWVATSALLCSQGFPVRPSFASPFGQPQNCWSFNFERDRSSTAVAGQSGNSMNGMVCGVLLVYSLLQDRVDLAFVVRACLERIVG